MRLVRTFSANLESNRPFCKNFGFENFRGKQLKLFETWKEPMVSLEKLTELSSVSFHHDKWQSSRAQTAFCEQRAAKLNQQI